MAKAKTAPTPPRAMPATGGSSIRDKATGALRPAPEPETTEPAADPAQKGD